MGFGNHAPLNSSGFSGMGFSPPGEPAANGVVFEAVGPLSLVAFIPGGPPASAVVCLWGVWPGG